MEIIFALIGGAILILIVAAVGHLIWLAMAAIVRLLTGGGQSESSHFDSGRSGSKSSDPNQQIRQDIQAANRLVGYATFKGWLDDLQLNTLKQLLADFAERHANERLYSAAKQNHQLPTQANSAVTNDIQRSTAAKTAPELPPLPLDDFVEAVIVPAAIESLPDNTSTASAAIAEPPELSSIASNSLPAQVVPAQAIPAQATPLPGTPQINHMPASVHPLDAPINEHFSDGTKSVLKSPQRPPLGADLLRTFMEKSNIRWIEIVSALLVVACSVGLVISLWNTLSATSRFFPSMVFLFATIAVHGAGQYTLRKWKLRSTSRGILHIGLMLIPLAVLVGILLSRRPGQEPQLDGGTIAVLTLGSLIYGALAATASRALFSSRAIPVAAAVIIGSLTLVPIHFISSKGLLPSPRAAIALMPLVLITLLNVLQLSSLATQPILSSGRMRRIAGQVLQVIFSALVPCIFWVMQSKGVGLSQSAVTAAGMLFAGWASWGWTASLKNLVAGYESDQRNGRASKSSSGVSWYIVVAWCLAGVCTLALAAIVWQTMDNRTLLVIALLGLASWWYVHGLRCGLVTSQFAATVSVVAAVSIFVEGLLPEAQKQLVMADWLSLPRVGLLSIFGLLAGAIGIVVASRFQQRPGLQTVLTTIGGLQASLTKLPVALTAGAAAVLLLTAGLTLVASLAHFSKPAFGGNWAPLMLLGYGSLILAAGILQSQTNSPSSSARHSSFLLRISQALVPVGQLVLLLATFKLCHSAPWAPQWLVDLRPMRAWAIGTGGLALIWAAIASVLRLASAGQPVLPTASPATFETPRDNQRSWRHAYSTQWLAMGAIGLVVVSAATYWSRGDKLSLASSAGWLLPAVLGLSFVALRQAVLREFTMLAVSAWGLSLLTFTGWHYGWWSQLGLAATTSVLAIAQLLALLAYRLLLGHDTDSIADWKRAGPRWSSGLLLNLTWIATLLTAAIPLALQLYFNLRGSQLVEKFFESAPLTPSRSVYLFLALLGLTLFTYSSSASKSALYRNWLAVVPLTLAAMISCQIASPYGVPTLLWMVAFVLLVLEWLPMTNTVWGKQLAEQNQQIMSGKASDSPESWLHTAKLFSLASLILVSLGVLLTYRLVGLPEPLEPLSGQMLSWSDWIRNVARVSLWTGPLTLVLAVRWLQGLVSAAPSKWVVQRGYSLGLFVSFVCVFSASHDYKTVVLFGSQSFSLVMLIISAMTVGFTALRNWIGLRQLDRQSTAWQVLNKACRGSRWRGAHQSAWQLWLGSITLSIVLSAIAGGLVAYYPRHAFSEIHILGGFWTIATVMASIGMWWVLRNEDGLPRVGLLAITLGLLSPIFAVGYASWLMNHPGSASVAAGGYEPYRLQIGMWLASLLVGLSIRVFNAAKSIRMPQPVEACWIVLAILVGTLSLFGISDANWATAQLALLAAIIAVSCEASGQTWRGFVAATVGMLAWAPWILNGLRTHGLYFAWQSLTAVVSIALLVVLVRQAFRLKQIDIRQQINWTIDRVAVLAIPSVSILLSGLWTMLDPASATLNSWVLWSVLGMVVLTSILAAVRLFEPQSCQRGLGVYLATIALTLVAIEFACTHFQVARVYCQLAWWSGLLAAMAVMAAMLKELTLQRISIPQFLQSKNLAEPAKLIQTTTWMATLHTVVALFCLIPSVWLVLTMNQEGLRLAAIALPLLGAAAIAPLSFERLRTFQRGSVLLLVSATLVLAWWADLPSAWALREPHESWLFVQRAFLAFVFLSVLYPTVAYFRNESDQWKSTLSKGGWICGALAALGGSGLILGTALGHWGDYPGGISLVAKLMTCLGWAFIFARLLQFAAWPQGLDKLASPTARTIAVYGAEIALALGCAATYYHFPDLFNKGRFVNWWPVILLGIAFASMMLGQWLSRIDLPLLADPIRRSSLLLPIIPLAGVWAFEPQRATLLWNDFERFAVLLVIGSSLYGLHGWVSGSVRLRVLSAALALLGFWSFLHGHPDMRFFEHPQFWLLPPAIGSLIFVEWNRSRLDSTVVTSVRYLSILVAYFSSTSEVFFRSFEGNLWPPIFLLFLAVCGVIAGIVLRVRAFLFCGLAFVIIALVGMVWHAAQAIDQVWPWFAFGIAIGVGLIILRGYFEKNRAKILNYLEELKQWEK